MATKEEILEKHFNILRDSHPEEGINKWEEQNPNDLQLVYDAMEEYANQECAAKDAEIKSILAAVARGDDLAFSLAFDGELSPKQKLEAEIDELNSKLSFLLVDAAMDKQKIETLNAKIKELTASLYNF